MKIKGNDMTAETKPVEKKEPVKLTVYQAISQVTERLAKEGISKDKIADTGRGTYKFRGIDDVYNALAPFLAEAGLTVLPFCLSREVVERQSSKGTALFYTTVTMRFDFVSKWDGSKHEVCMYGEAMDSGDKGTNKAMSAAFKYACMQAFCIPTEGDNDTENQTHEVKSIALVSNERAVEIDILLRESGADRKAFLEYFKATDVQSIKEKDFDVAIQLLNRKKKHAEPTTN